MTNSETAFMALTAAYFRDQNNFAAGFQFDLVSILEYLAVDRDRHAFLNLIAEARIVSLQLADKLPERCRFHFELGLATSELVTRPARGDDDFRQSRSFFWPRPRPRPGRRGLWEETSADPASE